MQVTVISLDLKTETTQTLTIHKPQYFSDVFCSQSYLDKHVTTFR